MKPFAFCKSTFFLLLVLSMMQFACSFGSPSPNPAPQQSNDSSPVPNPSNAEQIVVSGAVSKTFPPVRVNIGKFGADKIRLYMYEETPKDLSRVGDALTIDFPANFQPGTYAFDNSIDNTSLSQYAIYTTTAADGTPAAYKSIKGTLNLTAVGSAFSGQFAITMADQSNVSKMIDVSGSFTDLPINP